MSQLSKKSYIICSTPRTGSSLLCSLLKSTKVAGNPESYFREQDINKWALELGVVGSVDESVDAEKYLKAVVEAGSTVNGVFAMRIMWGSMEIVMNFLGTGKENNDYESLVKTFGQAKFIYLERDEKIAQAVSLWRALQTNVWHQLGDSKENVISKEPEYNFEKIHNFVLETEEHNAQWERWFVENYIEPYKVFYEDVVEDAEKAVKEILNYLEIDFSDSMPISAPNKKLSDETNLEWIEQYKKDVSVRTSH